jgi:hypothetical protein
MTVINTMQFNDKSGGMVTDSQSSTTLRRYDIAEKVDSVNSSNGTKAFVGGTGSTSLLYEARRKLMNDFHPEREFTTEEVAWGLGKILTGIGRDLIDKEMKGSFGFGQKEYISGRLEDGTPIGQHILGPAGELYQGREPRIREANGGGFLVLGSDIKGISLYSIPMGERPFLNASPYGSVGSGSDESDKALYDFVKSLPREERHSINLVKGMAALIRATNRSSDINQGVGGIPTVAYFNENGMVKLNENASLLSTEIVKALDQGLVPNELALKSLEDLLFDREKHQSIEENIFLKSDNYVNIMRFLRGYRSNGD